MDKERYILKELIDGKYYVCGYCIVQVRGNITHDTSDVASIPYYYNVCITHTSNDVYEDSILGLPKERYLRDATDFEIHVAEMRIAEYLGTQPSVGNVKTLLLKLEMEIRKIYNILDKVEDGQQG